MKIAFFGTPEIAVTVLKRLKLADIIPDLIISNPDAKVGRKAILTSPPAALYAKENSINLLQPETLKDETITVELAKNDWDVFIVVAYGKILPKWLLDLPKNGVLNVHPSLLPKLRGASPIRSAILNNERNTGVSIMLLDEKMDHGPILAQEKALISVDEWPMDGLVLDQILADLGGDLLVTTLTKYLNKEISPKEQNHEEATFCTKITKEMSELQLDPNNLPTGNEAYQILLKIRAFAGWPETFFIHDGKRVKIKSAVLDNTGRLVLKRIIPEGKKEMDFSVYFSH
jgi:methionyl-tRNA formyltransferase